jgi:hypothetical protein
MVQYNRPWRSALVVVAVWCASLAGALAQEASDSPAKAVKPRPRLGMNLNGPADYNTELPFVDVFRFSRLWISQKKGDRWGNGPALALDEHGWVRKLDADCWAETLLCTIQGGHYPSGEYTVLYEGSGKLDVWGAATVVSREPGRMTIRVDATKGGIFLRLLETDPANYVRNLRVIMPGFEANCREEPFHPTFLRRWHGVACLRFMDWMHTNGSKVARWSERPKPEDATFSGQGVALEVMIDLCNRLDADPWFCMPHLADDEYVRNFARMVKEKLNPNRKVYVEYSNEVLNGIFEQHRYAERRAKELGLGPAARPWEGACMFYARRSVEIFKIWQEVFGGTDRLVRVLAWQAGSGPYWTDGMLLSQPGISMNVDALAIAPYLTFCVPEQSSDPKRPNAATVSKWTVEEALDHMETKALPESVAWIRTQKKVAEKYGLKLVAYEGGQHMVGVLGGENNEAMTRLFQAANRHPRMGEIYRKYFDAWTAEGGDLFCYFSSTGSWSKWGSWGILEWFDEGPANSPKFMATLSWAKQCGQKMEGAPEHLTGR